VRTKFTAIGVGIVAARPVTRSTNVSAITCPRERPSQRASASRRSAAYTETPWATGKSAVRYVMVSGAGRMVTVRSFSASAARATTA